MSDFQRPASFGTQGSLEDFARTHSRAGGSGTSRAAAALASMRAGTIKAKILRCLIDTGYPMGFEEIAVRTGLGESSVWKRISDLKNDGLIYADGTVTNRTGAQAARWRVR